jgi:predicted GIY-YIG superfamily endonuclease
MALNAELRLKEHNAGKSKHTKGYMPWKIIYTEEHPYWGLKPDIGFSFKMTTARRQRRAVV